MLILAFFSGFLASAMAKEVSVIGLTAGSAVLAVDGGRPRTLRVGESALGVKLLGASSDEALLEVDGVRRTVRLSQGMAAAPAQPGAGASVTLAADPRGHFVAEGSINGVPLRFLVDTGATLISLSSGQAKRLGVDYLKGEPGLVSTANGVARVYRVRLDSVKVGEIVMHQVDALIHEGNALPVALLGMSFLNRVEIRRDGSQMVLIKRY